ncbi:unnamed protein product [Vitrella brassicaformis CCMP3155]|uniref:P-type domain-containing protein n=2 Tax=Vitrella brassicaformis TaxID=1169539 RepID=A0A0G4FZL7_VITBC|nr:unnamed protein product [Vitrella brassicaformis CCMP3155]|eukprot:CEM21081.1 unnamed protein product [Vitrella brassicaformis CCMP3155]
MAKDDHAAAPLLHLSALLCLFCCASGITDAEVANRNADQVLNYLKNHAGAVTSLRSGKGGRLRTNGTATALRELWETTPFRYAHPLPNALLVSPYTSIALRPAGWVAPWSVKGKIKVRGEQSGDRSQGQTRLLPDNRTIWFKPDRDFFPGERVFVDVRSGIRTRVGKVLPAAQWSFSVSWRKIDTYRNKGFIKLSTDGNGAGFSSPENLKLLKMMRDNDWLLGLPSVSANATDRAATALRTEYLLEVEDRGRSRIVPNSAYRTLPSTYPRAILTRVGDTSKLSSGYLFTTEISHSKPYKTMQVIMTDRGDPVYYEKGTLASFAPTHNGEVILRSSGYKIKKAGPDYRLTGGYEAGHGHVLNHHELRVTKSGTALLIIYDPQLMNSKKIRADVWGASTSTWVAGLCIQEVLTTGEVMFEWRSWDHLPRVYWETNMSVEHNVWDLTHANSLDESPEGNIIVSLRGLQQVAKINRNTGRVEWRLGGRRPELSSFKIKDDPNGVFSGQHDARITKQGLLTMFDNSVRTGSRTARAVDYALEWEDDSPAIARQVSVFNTGVSAFAKGSYRRMPNGNRVMCLGMRLTADKHGRRGNPFYLETDEGNNTLVMMRWARETHSYRVIKAPWVGLPPYKPTVLFDVNNKYRSLRLHFSWNGATEVAKWRVLEGPTDEPSDFLIEMAKTQFEHWIEVNEGVRQCLYYQVVPIGKNGTEMRPSDVVKSPACGGGALGKGKKRVKAFIRPPGLPEAQAQAAPRCNLMGGRKVDCAPERLSITADECAARGCCFVASAGKTIQGLIRCYQPRENGGRGLGW